MLAAQAGAHRYHIAALQVAGGDTGILAVRAHMTWPFAADEGAEHVQRGDNKEVQAKLKAELGEDEEAAADLNCQQCAFALGPNTNAPPSSAQ